MKTIPTPVTNDLNAFQPDLSALQDKTTYLAFRDAWRYEYKALSLDRRSDTILYRSSMAKASQAKKDAAEVACQKSGAMPVTVPVSCYAYWTNPSGKVVTGSKAMLNWLLWLRRESKRQAQLGYLRSKNAQTPSTSC